MNLFKNLKIKFAVAILVLSCGCTTWKWKNNPPTYYEWNINEDLNRRGKNHYYVIDANADVPDAYFKTKSEALTYQKEFAEYHDYVIVKIDRKYNVYSMEKPRIMLDN